MNRIYPKATEFMVTASLNKYLNHYCEITIGLNTFRGNILEINIENNQVVVDCGNIKQILPYHEIAKIKLIDEA